MGCCPHCSSLRGDTRPCKGGLPPRLCLASDPKSLQHRLLPLNNNPSFGSIGSSPFLFSFPEEPEQPFLLLVSSNFPLGALTLSVPGVAAGQRALRGRPVFH